MVEQFEVDLPNLVDPEESFNSKMFFLLLIMKGKTLIKMFLIIINYQLEAIWLQGMNNYSEVIKF